MIDFRSFQTPCVEYSRYLVVWIALRPREPESSNFLDGNVIFITIFSYLFFSVDAIGYYCPSLIKSGNCLLSFSYFWILFVGICLIYDEFMLNFLFLWDDENYISLCDEEQDKFRVNCNTWGLRFYAINVIQKNWKNGS